MHSTSYGRAPICPLPKRDHCIGVCIGCESGMHRAWIGCELGTHRGISGGTKRGTSVNMPLLRLRSSDSKLQVQCLANRARTRVLLQAQSCTFTEVARLVPSGIYIKWLPFSVRLGQDGCEPLAVNRGICEPREPSKSREPREPTLVANRASRQNVNRTEPNHGHPASWGGVLAHAPVYWVKNR